MSALRNCADCARPMRRKGDRAADYPGTAIIHGRGICKTCYWRETHPESARGSLMAAGDLAGRGAPHTDQHNLIALAEYLASRRARLATQNRHLTRSTA